MTKRESRVINAFINCIKNGEFTAEYATILIEDQSKYGWLSDAAKDYFYEQIEPEESESTESTESTEE